jgi:hypothetical protein
MKLYHFCRASDLDSIADKGLYPHVPTEPVMSLGRVADDARNHGSR